MDPPCNNFSTLVHGKGGGRGPAMCVYAIRDSWPAGLMIQWTQHAHAQSPRNALRIAEILNRAELSTGSLYSLISIRNS